LLKAKYLELKLEVVWFYGYDKRHFSEKHFFLYPGLKNAVKFAFNEGRSISVKDWMSGLWRLPRSLQSLWNPVDSGQYL